jgi:hypothetical protein
MQYDQSYNSNMVASTVTAGTYLWVEPGRNQELAQVQSVNTTTGANGTTTTQVQLKFVSSVNPPSTPIMSQGHPGGATLVNVLPGNPGPQSQFDYNSTRYKQSVVPYASIVQ